MFFDMIFRYRIEMIIRLFRIDNTRKTTSSDIILDSVCITGVRVVSENSLKPTYRRRDGEGGG